MGNEKLLSKSSLGNWLFEALPISFYLVDADDFTIRLSNRISKGEQKVIFSCCSNDPGNDHADSCPFAEVLETGEILKTERVVIDSDGVERIFQIHDFPVSHSDGSTGYILEFHVDVTGHRENLTDLQLLQALIDVMAESIAGIDPGPVAPAGEGGTSQGCTRDDLLQMHMSAHSGPEKDGPLQFIAGEISNRARMDESIQAQNNLVSTLINSIPSPIFYSNQDGLVQGCNGTFENLVGLRETEIIGRDIKDLGIEGLKNCAYEVDREPDSLEKSHTCEIRVRFSSGRERIFTYTQTRYMIPDEEAAGIIGVLQDITEYKRMEEALHDSNRRLEEMNARFSQNQDQLIQSEKLAAIGQLAAGVAHEINNPVGYVKSNIGTLSEYVTTVKELLQQYYNLEEAIAGGDETRQAEIRQRIVEIKKDEEFEYMLEDVDLLLEESIDGVERVKEIVQGLKSFARIDESQTKEANVNELIEITLKMVWNELKYKCNVEKDLKHVPLITCYPGQLNQVIMNLLVNAAQAIPGKGDISISTEACDGHVVIRIRDTGVGIPKEHIPRLFDPFFTTKQVGKGTGLGLSVSHGIVQKHNGTIEVESEVGKGTTFTIRLPIEGAGDD